MDGCRHRERSVQIDGALFIPATVTAAQLCPILLGPHGLQSAKLPCPWDFSQQEHWRGLPFPPSGDIPNPEIELASLASPALAGRFFTTVPPGKPIFVPNFSKSINELRPLSRLHILFQPFVSLLMYRFHSVLIQKRHQFL